MNLRPTRWTDLTPKQQQSLSTEDAENLRWLGRKQQMEPERFTQGESQEFNRLLRKATR